ncbi:MAG: hypothetical protein ABI852_01845 [Gemmatimonadaceae bacterium]
MTSFSETSEQQLREYRWEATDHSVTALRRLRAGWAGYIVGTLSFTALLADGDFVRIEMEPVDVEGVFDAYRVSASVNPVPRTEEELDGDTPKDWPTEPISAPGTLADAGNDVVLFTGASWSEPANDALAAQLGPSAVMTFSGASSHLSPTAEIVCITTDAFVVASTSGEGILIRSGLKPESVEVVIDPVEVRRFLVDRGYVSDE